jgi:hypothetical protein
MKCIECSKPLETDGSYAKCVNPECYLKEYLIGVPVVIAYERMLQSLCIWPIDEPNYYGDAKTINVGSIPGQNAQDGLRQ